MALLNQLVFSASQAQFHKAATFRRQQAMGSLPSVKEEEDSEMMDEQAPKSTGMEPALRNRHATELMQQ